MTDAPDRALRDALELFLLKGELGRLTDVLKNAHHSEDQPRVLAGTPEGGQFASASVGGDWMRTPAGKRHVGGREPPRPPGALRRRVNFAVGAAQRAGAQAAGAAGRGALRGARVAGSAAAHEARRFGQDAARL
jgi:hypothetical protein